MFWADGTCGETPSPPRLLVRRGSSLCSGARHARSRRDPRGTLRALGHRLIKDYDPTTGTFLTRDPLDGVDGTPTTANPYHYADNDPLNRVDPTGLRTQEPDLGPPCDLGPDVAAFDGWGLLAGSVAPPCGFADAYYPPVLLVGRQAALLIYINPQGDHCSGGPIKYIALNPLLALEGDINFRDSCDAHDYGYDVLRYLHSELGSASWPDRLSNFELLMMRIEVDDAFLRMMNNVCADTGWLGLTWDRTRCGIAANAYYVAVRLNTERQGGAP